ncbi:MAG: hypothetical protein Q611_LSC00185G0001, partial [Leuconostoc sp. DORA_2]
AILILKFSNYCEPTIVFYYAQGGKNERI